jgi:hypothetical protein
MKLKDFRVGWRTLVQEPFYSLIVIGGLSIGLAAAMLLLAFVRYSFEYNSHVPDVERVYVVKQRSNIDPTRSWFDVGPVLLRNAALQAPGVQAATGYVPIRPQGSRFALKVDGQLHEVAALVTLPGFAEVLGLQAGQGDLAQALEQPEGLVLSEGAAQRLFGSEAALGRTVHAEGRLLRVAAIVPTQPSNSTVPFEALVGTRSVLVDEVMRKEMLSGEHGWWGKLLLRARPGASVPAITAVLQRAADEAPVLQVSPEMKAGLGGAKARDVALAPLRDAYFDREVSNNFISSIGHRGNPVQLTGLALLAVLIMGLAAPAHASWCSNCWPNRCWCR